MSLSARMSSLLVAAAAVTAETNPNTTQVASTTAVPVAKPYVVYKSSEGAISQSEASRLCQEREGYLATITTRQEEECACRALTDANLTSGHGPGWVILGGSDAEKEGTWVWKYGPPSVKGSVIWTKEKWPRCQQEHCHWHPGEPNNSDGPESTMVITRAGYSNNEGNAVTLSWIDVSDGATTGWSRDNTNRYYMCQFGTVPVPVCEDGCKCEDCKSGTTSSSLAFVMLVIFLQVIQVV